MKNTRDCVLEAIRCQPGQTLDELVAAVGRTENNTRKAIGKLRAEGLIERRTGERPSPTKITHYPAGHGGPAIVPRRRQRTTSKRTCLGCGGAFDSTGTGNRICARCKDTDIWRGGATDYGVAA